MAAFIATNVDGLFLTTALLASGAGRARQVVAGTFLGIGTLYAVSAAASLVSLVVPTWSIALLGLLPLGIGLKQLLGGRPAQEQAAPAAHGVLGVAGINIAFGGDNIGVYTPLFASGGLDAIAIYGMVFALLTALLCWLSHRLVTHPALGAPVRQLAPRLVPWVLIALGLWILAQGIV